MAKLLSKRLNIEKMTMIST